MGWKTHRRSDTGLIEHTCPDHGVGHPNAGSAEFIHYFWSKDRQMMNDVLNDTDDKNEAVKHVWSKGQKDNPWYVHGCCGCCGREDFPGTSDNAIAFALMNLDQEEVDYLKIHYYQLWWGLVAAQRNAVREEWE